MLSGDLIMRALQRRDPLINLNLQAAPAPWEELDQGGTDPGNIVEFLAYEIPFMVEPATGLIFPEEIHRG